MTMDSVHHVNVPLRTGKKMKKRKELDALVAHSAVAGKRCPSAGGGGGKRSGGSGGGGLSSHDGLLSETSDEDDYWVLGKTRGGRGRLLRHRACSSLLRACTVVLVFACVVATTTVMWLFIDIREQVTSLRIELDQVVAGSQGVPDALQKCHSMSRELQQNQTALFNRLSLLSLQSGNFTTQLISMQSGLQNLEERLKATPEIVSVPQQLKELRANVAMFGSQIRDLEATVTTLKDQYNQLQDTSRTLLQNVSTFQESYTQLLAASKHPQVVAQENKEEKAVLLNEIAQIAQNVTKINETLTSKFKWCLDDQIKDHAKIESLQNFSQNVSARVTTLEGECVRQSVFSSLNTTVKLLVAQINNGSVLISDLDKKITVLQSHHAKYELPLPSAMMTNNMNSEHFAVSEAAVSSSPVTPTSQQSASSVVPDGQMA